MFINPETCPTRGPPISIVAANAQAPANAAQKAPSDSKNTATAVHSTNHALRVTIAQAASELAPTPLRLADKLPVRRYFLSIRRPPRMHPISAPTSTIP